MITKTVADFKLCPGDFVEFDFTDIFSMPPNQRLISRGIYLGFSEGFISWFDIETQELEREYESYLTDIYVLSRLDDAQG